MLSATFNHHQAEFMLYNKYKKKVKSAFQWKFGTSRINSINPFHADVIFLYPLKTSENLWFSDVFREYRNGTIAWQGLKIFFWFSNQIISLLETIFWREIIHVKTPWTQEVNWTFCDVFRGKITSSERLIYVQFMPVSKGASHQKEKNFIVNNRD